MQPHHVPVTSTLLRPEETLLQMFDALADLDFAINAVFERIAARANEERLQLFSISQRLAVASSQVEFVKTLQNKATTVLSAPRYPLQTELKTFVPLHSTAPEQKQLHTKFYLNNAALQSADTMRASEIRSLGIEAVASDRQKGQNVEREGLGRLPDNLDSVSSLLLFNSNENPYKAYRNLDNLTGAGLKLRSERAKDDKTLAAAPGTLQEGLVLPNYAGEAVELSRNITRAFFYLSLIFSCLSQLRSCCESDSRIKCPQYVARFVECCHGCNVRRVKSKYCSFCSCSNLAGCGCFCRRADFCAAVFRSSFDWLCSWCTNFIFCTATTTAICK